MIRSNIGNVVTNGMQILSVGATTASRLFKGRADKTLRHPTLSEAENQTIQEATDKRALEQSKNYLAGKGNYPTLSKEENDTIQVARDKRAIDSANDYLGNDTDLSDIDMLMAKTEESKEIAKRTQEDIQYNLERTDYKRVDRPMYINVKTGKYAGKKELEPYKVGEKENADV